jgi:hypothetical protein
MSGGRVMLVCCLMLRMLIPLHVLMIIRIRIQHNCYSLKK